MQWTAQYGKTGFRGYGLTASVIVIIYSVLTINRIDVWRGPVELWSDAVRKHSGLSGPGPLASGDLTGQRPLQISGRLVTALAQAYARTGNIGEAKALMSIIQKTDKETETGSELTFARIAIDEGRLEDGLRLARKAAEGGTWLSADGWGLIGMIYAKQGSYDAAREAFNKSLEIYKKSGRSGARIMQDLGLVELLAGKPEEAADWYSRSRKEAPKEAGPVMGLAMAYEKTGLLKESLALYQEVLRLEPDHPQKMAIAGSIALLEKQIEGAERR
ncbi:MAG: tetratricopeptide repeat protein [Nitrospiraceae bacterium]|nr:MAG: tetratricopeptide repeat protein [Nitrospiraceae bacterium]